MSISEPKIVARRADFAQRSWVFLTHSWLLGVVGGALLILYGCALFLPQLPGQLVDDPAAAHRWELLTAERYGAVGRVFHALGLFDVIHHPLVQLLLTLLALIILVRLGAQVAQSWRLYHIHRHLAQPTINAEPIELPMVQPLFRLRNASSTEVTALTQRLQTQLREIFDTVERQVVTVAAVSLPVDEGAERPLIAGKQVEGAPGASSAERRLLGVRAQRHALLRPLLFAGLLLALITVWLTLNWGWSVTIGPLAPGADYRSAAYQLVVEYTVEPTTAPIDGARTTSPITATATVTTPLSGTPLLLITAGAANRRALLGTIIRLNQGQTLVANRAGPPALYLRTASGEPLLSRFGQSQMVPAMGLLFPSQGSEEVVVVDRTLGLRLIRLPTTTGTAHTEFLAELYDANNALLERTPIRANTATPLRVEAKTIDVEFILLPSIAVQVAHRPAFWLFWPALLLVVLGMVGYSQKPAFLLLQLAPWPVDRTVLVAQSDQPEEIQHLQQWLQHKAEPVTGEG
jgi:hypothetical protein